MKKLTLIGFIFLVPAISQAATFQEMTPDVIKGVTIRWEYKFGFKSSPTSPEEIVTATKDSCDRPVKHSDGQPLFPPAIICFKTEAEARADAQKDADKFEADFIAAGHKTEDIEDWKAKKIKTIDSPRNSSLWDKLKKAVGQ